MYSVQKHKERRREPLLRSGPNIGPLLELVTQRQPLFFDNYPKPFQGPVVRF